MWSLSAAAQTALQSSHDVALKCEVTDSSGNHLTYLDVAGGQVVEDESAPIRRTAALQLATTSLVPAEVGDLLHPLSGNELRPYRGVALPGVSLSDPVQYQPGGSMAPLGVFRTSKPQIVDTGDQLLITVTGNDRSSEISRRAWTGPYTAAAGVNVATAIKAIINAKWTGQPLTFNFAPTTVTVAAGTVLGIQFTSSGVQAQSGSTSGNNDPFADCVVLAKSAGMELFFDRVGTPTMRPVPTIGSIAPQIVFAEGVSCTMVELDRTLDEIAFYNQVIVIGTGATVTNSDGSTSPGAAVTATAASTDPQLGPSGPLGARTYFYTDQHIATVPQAQNAANALLPLVMATLDQTAFNATCNPAVDAGDTNGLARARMKVGGNYITSLVTHPLDAVNLMQVTNRSFLAAA